MVKKTLATVVTLGILVGSLAMPVFAQGQGNSNGGGLFGAFEHFFSQFFNQSGQNQGQQVEGNQTENSSGSAAPQNKEGRLQGQVTAGKITQAQEQEILNEVSTIKSEISTWSQSTGINAAYIYGALRGPGMSAGLGGQPDVSVTPGQQGQGSNAPSGQPQHRGFFGGPRNDQ